MDERPVVVTDCARLPGEKPLSLWNDILQRLGTYSYFQTPGWSSILQMAIPKATACHRWFHFSDGKEAILPLFFLPRRWGIGKLESLPWGGYGGLIGDQPLMVEHDQAAVKKVLTLRAPRCEISEPPILTENSSSDETTQYIDTRIASTHILQLSDSFEEIWSNCFQGRNRTAIRRARDRGVVINWSNGLEAVDAMKSLYQKAMDRWDGVETLPIRFFDSLRDWPGEEVRIWLAYYRDRAIAGNVILYGKGEAQYFAGASDLHDSKVNAARLLMSEIIRDACLRDYRIFNFGASGGLEGVERFKRIFGGNPHVYYRRVYSHPLLILIQNRLHR